MFVDHSPCSNLHFIFVFAFSTLKVTILRDYDLVLKWYQSYVADLTQTFQVELDRSKAFIIDCSVPQGSVLGPLKFVAYTEDLPSVIEKHDLDHHLYADDTQIADHLQPTQAAAGITNIERCVESVHVWCTSKRLQLNPTKLEIIWFGFRTGFHRLHGVDLSLLLVQTSSHRSPSFVISMFFWTVNS